jgi:hypothetical protein
VLVEAWRGRVTTSTGLLRSRYERGYGSRTVGSTEYYVGDQRVRVLGSIEDTDGHHVHAYMLPKSRTVVAVERAAG